MRGLSLRPPPLIRPIRPPVHPSILPVVVLLMMILLLLMMLMLLLLLLMMMMWMLYDVFNHPFRVCMIQRAYLRSISFHYHVVHRQQ